MLDSLPLTLTPTELAASAVCVVGATSFAVQRLTRRASSLPPGPAPLPVVGNWLDLPVEKPWRTYANWAEQYASDLIHLRVFGTNVIIVNSSEAAKALFVKRAAQYSRRPRLPMINELVGLFWHFGFMDQGEQWKIHRKIFSDDWNPAAVKKQHDEIKKWTKTFVENLTQDPDHFSQHIQHMQSGFYLEATYGLQVQPSGQPDPFIGAATTSIEAIGAAGMFGSYLVDFLPSLKYIPSLFAKFKRQAEHWRVSVDIAASVPFALAKQAHTEGTVPPSLTSTLLAGSQPHEEDVIRQSTAAMFASGSAGPVAAMNTFFLAMVMYPEVQAKAQEELDRVLQGRLPDFSDEPSLPYLTAVIRETLRWNPVVPLGFPHQVTSDDTYDGKVIPAGSVIVPNAWAILHEEETWGPNTEDFVPERFLNADGTFNKRAKDPQDAAYGFARRSCPGRYAANASMFHVFATTLSLFTLSKKLDKSGKPIGQYGDYTTGLLSYPVAFAADIKPRAPKVSV